MNTTTGMNAVDLVTLLMASIPINAILFLPLNVYVVWLILTGTKASLTSDIFIVNLAMSEIVLSSSGLCSFISMWFNFFIFVELFAFTTGLIFTARPLFQCCICVERYVGVVHPVFFLRCKPLRYRVACCCVAWIISLASCIYFRFTISNHLYLYAFFIQNVLILSVLIYCCISVLWALKRQGPGEKKEDSKSNTMKRRAFKIISLNLLQMTLNLFLYVVPIPLQCCVKPRVFEHILTICTSSALATGFIYPLLYMQRTGTLNCFRKL